MSVASTLNELTSETLFATKWPNDVLGASGKVAGILCERYSDGIIVGIGINVSTRPEELPVETASSVFIETGVELDRNILLPAILEKFKEFFERWESGEDLSPKYRALSATIGEQSTFARLCIVSFPTVGVIGAGQLARMMVPPAVDLGISLSLFAGASTESGAQVAPHVVGSLADTEAVLAWASHCDVVTFEHELIPQELIVAIENSGVKVFPKAESFRYSQNKLEMRRKMQELGLPNPRWQEYRGEEVELEFPLIAKSISGGYDGRGVFLIENEQQLLDLHSSINKPLLLEERLNFDYEIAIMVARSPHGQAATWAPTLTVQRDGICTQTVTPIPDISEELAQQTKDSNLYRPYLHLMARTPALKVHQYMKELRPGRKVGHVTLLGNDLLHLSNSEIAAKIGDLMESARVASLEKGKSLNAKRNHRTGF
eukprot:gene1248-1264_t